MGTMEQPGQRHLAKHEGGGATTAGAAGGESQDARQGLGIQGRKASNPGLDHLGQETASRPQAPPGLENLGDRGRKPWTGTSGDEASGPGLERPGLHKVEEKWVAATTGLQGKRDQQKRTNKRRSTRANKIKIKD